MGSDENRFIFNVSLIVRDKVPSPQTTTFEEKVEPKRIRPEVLLLTSLTRLTARPNRLTKTHVGVASFWSHRTQWAEHLMCRWALDVLLLIEVKGGGGGGGGGRKKEQEKKKVALVSRFCN